MDVRIRLAEIDAALVALESRRRALLWERHTLLAAVPAPPPVYVAPPPAPVSARARRETRPVTAQAVLLGLGGLLLSVAAIVFTVVAWGRFGIAGRAVVLGVLTAGVLAVPVLLRRRGLAGSAEAVGSVGLVLCLLDAYALSVVAGFSSFAYAGAVSLVLAGGWWAYGRALSLRSALVAGVVVGQWTVPLFVRAAGSSPTWLAGAYVVTAVLDLVVLAAVTGAVRAPWDLLHPRVQLATLHSKMEQLGHGSTCSISDSRSGEPGNSGGVHSPVEQVPSNATSTLLRPVAWVAGVCAGLCWGGAVLAVLGPAFVSVGPALVLVLAALAAGLGVWLLLVPVLREIAAGLAVGAGGLGMLALLRPVTGVTLGLALVGSALAGAYAVAPAGPWRQGGRWPALGLGVAACVGPAGAALALFGAYVQPAGRPWHGMPALPDSYDGLLDGGLPAGLAAGALVLAVAVAITRRVDVLVGGGAVLVLLMAGLLPYPYAIALLTVAAAAAWLVGRPAQVVTAGVLGLAAVGASLASRPATLLVLGALTLAAAAAGKRGYGPAAVGGQAFVLAAVLAAGGAPVTAGLAVLAGSACVAGLARWRDDLGLQVAACAGAVTALGLAGGSVWFGVVAGAAGLVGLLAADQARIGAAVAFAVGAVSQVPAYARVLVGLVPEQVWHDAQALPRVGGPVVLAVAVAGVGAVLLLGRKAVAPAAAVLLLAAAAGTPYPVTLGALLLACAVAAAPAGGTGLVLGLLAVLYALGSQAGTLLALAALAGIAGAAATRGKAGAVTVAVLAAAGEVAAGTAAAGTPAGSVVAAGVAGLGALLGLAALAPALRGLAWPSAGLLLLAGWIELGTLAVRVPEAYTGPAAAVALLAGRLRRRSVPTASSWLDYGAGLTLGLVPSLAVVLDGPEVPLRTGALALAGLVAAVYGGYGRLRAPLTAGAVVVAVLALHELGPEVAAWVGGLPRWIPIAVAGLLLLVVGATYERRLRDLRALRRRYERLA